MSDDNNHIKFTTADIEKYHKGTLTASQRHALEKAALDDPFLADALEGYAYSADTTSELADLDNRMQQRLGKGKLVPLQQAGVRRIPWLRVAVMLVFLAGAAVLASQFLFTKKEQDIAALDKKKDAPGTNAEREKVTVSPETSVKTDSTVPEISGSTTVPPTPPKTNEKPVNGEGLAIVTPSTQEIAAPEKTEDKSTVKEKNADLVKNEVPTGNSDKGKAAEEVSAYRQDEETAKKKSVVAQARAAQKMEPVSRMNTFRGRVTDDNNRGLPFANVTNTRDNVGTYTDVSGNFVLTSPDTTLDVQIRSLGYDNGYVQLRNTVPNNTVVLKDDNEVVANTLSTRSNSNAKRRQEDNMKVEEPEPADGWENYDVYLANNLNVPIDFQPKPSLSQEVELSFEVNRNGEPVNIRVERSLCKSCDQEAIRLIKDGPKWKRTTKKRTRVTVAF